MSLSIYEPVSTVCFAPILPCLAHVMSPNTDTIAHEGALLCSLRLRGKCSKTLHPRLSCAFSPEHVNGTVYESPSCLRRLGVSVCIVTRGTRFDLLPVLLPSSSSQTRETRQPRQRP
jgi:hypothetical protein